MIRMSQDGFPDESCSSVQGRDILNTFYRLLGIESETVTNFDIKGDKSGTCRKVSRVDRMVLHFGTFYQATSLILFCQD